MTGYARGPLLAWHKNPHPSYNDLNHFNQEKVSEMHGPFGFELALSKPFHGGAPDRQIPARSQKFVQGDSRVICHWPSTSRE